MRKLINLSLVIVFVSILGACGSTTQESPTSIVQKYYAAINAQKLDEAISYLADDVLTTSPQGRIQGKEAVSKNLGVMVRSNFKSENSNYRETNGEVRYDYIVYIGGSEVDRNTDGLTIVKDGKIVFDGLERDKPQ